MIRKHSHVKIGRYHQVKQDFAHSTSKCLHIFKWTTWLKYLHLIYFKCFVLFFLLQHLTEQLELDLSPLEYMMKCFPEIKEKEEMRKIIGRYGLTGKQQVGLGCSPSGLNFLDIYVYCLKGDKG